MTDGTAALNESILNLPEIITLADAETVDYLELMYNATSSDQKAFVQNVAKLQRAIAEVKRLRAEQNADTPDDPNPTPPIESPTDGLPTYAIVLIVVGAVVLTAGVGVTVVLLVIKKKKTASQRADGSASDDPSDTTEAAAPTDSEETAEKKGEDTHEE